MYAASHASDTPKPGARLSRNRSASRYSLPERGRGDGVESDDAMRNRQGTGKVFLVGAGPGDPELLTVKALRLISSAQAVVYDHLVGDEVIALIPPGARRVYAGKEAGNHALPQDQINALLVSLAREGLTVVRPKGGDPFIFGRGGEEMQSVLDAGFACEIVPGITAAAGAAACTGIPLTHRAHAQTLVFATGHLKDDTVDLDWEALARPCQTVVIYMGLGALEQICAQMVAHGLPGETPAAVIHAATTARQCGVHSTLAGLPAAVRKAGMKTPALIMIGEVVSLDPGLLLAKAGTAMA